MSGHTKGPWIVEVNEKSAAISILGARGDGDNRSSDGLGRLATIDCAAEPDAVMFSPMLPEQVANAHLMGAALDLLAALKAMEETLCDGFNTQAQRFAGRKALIAARAAIARAEGRQP